MDEISRGAEAVIYRDGDDVVKQRVGKGYRLPDLDERLREERTKIEARLLTKARRAGVLTPVLREKGETEIRMEFLDAPAVKDVIDDMDPTEGAELAEEIGRYVGALHRNGMIHGDLTTSNMLLGDQLYFIDFGLGYHSKSVEDRATDLHLLYNVLHSTHPDHCEEMWEGILEGYMDEFPKAERIITRLEKVIKRGRYVER